jgi:hypothetical protein
MTKINKIKKGSIISGFKVMKIESIKSQGIVYYELEHIGTGAQYIHLETDDQENTFCVAFKTLPSDSSGVAHILEHTVLMGSKKYPVRDPFFSMIKRSLRTFMNAFTASDWTAYPFSTQNKKDYYNLMSVYLDATFFPEISELSFMQEGCHLEYVDGKLAWRGVVFNEMKGSMSSVDRVMEQSIMSALYPNSTYRFNSGGDPKAIPSLTYEQLKKFHQRFYHPSNARFYSYGNFPLLRHLQVIDRDVLSKFSRINPRTNIKAEPKWKQAKEFVFQFPIDKQEKINKKYQVGMSWLMAAANNPYEVLVLEILEYVLLGNQSSPLRKALVSSGLGSDLSDGTGFDAENRNTMFSVGLKDVRKRDRQQIKKTIFEVLERILKEGIEIELIESAVQKQEFYRREKTNNPYPYGLSLYLRIISGWLHGGDPLDALCTEEMLKRLRIDLEKPRFLEKKLEQYFLKNQNRALIMLEPNAKLSASNERDENQRLAKIAARLTKEAKAEIKSMAEKLRAEQTRTVDTNILPTLELSDINPGVVCVKSVSDKDKKNISLFEQETNGLFYAVISFEVENLPSHLLYLVPFFCYCLLKIGTKNKSYDVFAREIGLVCGDMSFSPTVMAKQDKSKQTQAFIFLNSKCLEKNLKKMLELIKEQLIDHSFTDKDRLKELAREYLAGFESDIVPSGHQYAQMLACRGFSETQHLNEAWHGISQYKYFKEYVKSLDDSIIKKMISNLEDLATQIFANDMASALIGCKKSLEKGANLLALLQKAMPFKTAKKVFANKLKKQKFHEGWTTTSAVSFSACAFESLPLEHIDAPVLAVISKILSMLFLLKEIREKRGAYGGFAKYSPQENTFSLGSYRDPHVFSTINVFMEAFEYIRNTKFSETDIKEAILAVVSEIDKPDTPAEAAKNAFRRQLVSLSDKDRHIFKERLLKVKPADVKRVADKYFVKKWSDLSVVFIGNETKLINANKKLGEKKLGINKID